METDANEAISMSKVFLPIGILVFSLSFILILFATKEMRNKKRIHPAISISYLILGVLIIPNILSAKEGNHDKEIVLDTFKVSPFLFLSEVICVKYPFITGDIFLYAAYCSEMRKFRESATKNKKLPEGIILNKTEDNPPKIILVIGESALRTHFSLYGYELPTTPFLDSLYTHSEQLSLYNDIISPAGYTRESLRITLSFATVHEKQPFLEEKNLLNLANDANYETFWISSQGRFGLHDNYIGMVASCAKNASYQDGLDKDDLKLVPMLKNVLKKDKQQFICMHLRGSHMSYKDMYDKKDSEALGYEGKTIDYDKTIHHTDRFFREVYNTLNTLEDNFIILYLSDHAEVINSGHGIRNKFKDQFKIPFLTIQKGNHRDTHAIIKRYYNEECGLLNSSSMIYILAEILGYQVPEFYAEKARKETEYIYQTDGSIKRFSEIVN